MATTTNRDHYFSDGWIYDYGVASGVQVYAGTILETKGGNVRSVVAGATTLAGISEDNINNTSTNTELTSITAAGLRARVRVRGIVRLKAAGTPTAADINQQALPVDNDTVGVTNAFGVSGGVATLGMVRGFGTVPYNYYDVDLFVK